MSALCGGVSGEGTSVQRDVQLLGDSRLLLKLRRGRRLLRGGRRLGQLCAETVVGLCATRTGQIRTKRRSPYESREVSGRGGKWDAPGGKWVHARLNRRRKLSAPSGVSRFSPRCSSIPSSLSLRLSHVLSVFLDRFVCRSVSRYGGKVRDRRTPLALPLLSTVHSCLVPALRLSRLRQPPANHQSPPLQPGHSMRPPVGLQPCVQPRTAGSLSDSSLARSSSARCGVSVCVALCRITRAEVDRETDRASMQASCPSHRLQSTACHLLQARLSPPSSLPRVRACVRARARACVSLSL